MTTYETKLAVAEGTLTAAQIKTLFTAGIDVIPAPGANLFIEVVKVMLKLRFNSIAYTIVGVTGFVAQYKGGADVTANMQTLLDDAASGIIMPIPVAVQDTVANLENKAIELIIAGANPAAGDSEIDYVIHYRVHEVTPSIAL
jgi:hypothetical protein